MDAQDCLQILREIKDVAFATVDQNGQPQVRIIDVMIVREEKLYFVTARGKDFYKELEAAGTVSVIGLNKQWQTVRLTGKVKRLPEQKLWIDRIIEENPSMKAVYPGESRYILEPFCIAEGELEFFDLGREPIYRERFSLGAGKVKEKGFLIGTGCIDCGACKQNCPQQCIDEGVPYKIRQENCLHCGLCTELCPVAAIKRRGEDS